MIASTLPQVSLWVEEPAKLTFPMCTPPVNYPEEIHDRFSRRITEALSNVTICTEGHVTVKRLENDPISNEPKPFTNEEVAITIAAMLCAFNISVSLPSVNCEVVRPFVSGKPAEDMLHEMRKDDQIYHLIQQKVDDLWCVG